MALCSGLAEHLMGVYVGYGAGVDVAVIAAEMRPAVELWMNGEVMIVDPEIATGDFDPWTNTIENGDPAVIWIGKARIQQLGVSKANLQFGSTEIAGIRFQIPRDIAEQGTIRKGLQVYVINGGEDTTLQDFQYIVRQGVNSSGMWTRTIEASVDLGQANAEAPEVP